MFRGGFLTVIGSMTAEQIAHWVGVMVGASVVGGLLGVIPLILGHRQKRMRLGWIAFACTFVSALILGAILSLPVSAGFSLYIHFTKPKS